MITADYCGSGTSYTANGTPLQYEDAAGTVSFSGTQGAVEAVWTAEGALCLGTTVLIKMGRKRYAWTTAVPLVFLTAVTFTAGLQKIFGTWPAGKFGFLDIARDRAAKLASGGAPEQTKLWKTEIFNNYLDAAVAGFFLVMVALILAGSIREWVRLLTGRKAAVLRESPYVALPERGGV